MTSEASSAGEEGVGSNESLRKGRGHDGAGEGASAATRTNGCTSAREVRPVRAGDGRRGTRGLKSIRFLILFMMDPDGCEIQYRAESPTTGPNAT
jgi:hypothetical protein